MPLTEKMPPDLAMSTAEMARLAKFYKTPRVSKTPVMTSWGTMARCLLSPSNMSFQPRIMDRTEIQETTKDRDPNERARLRPEMMNRARAPMVRLRFRER